MSTINKKPFLKYVLESMSPTQIGMLKSLVDGGGVQTPILRTMNLPSGNRTNITSSDKGVHLCDLEVGFTLFRGYLVYTNSYCALFYFTDSTMMGMFNIDLGNLRKYETVSESLTVVEFRSELIDTPTNLAALVPENQSTTIIVKDQLTNINGWLLTSYNASLYTVGGYTFYKIFHGEGDCTREQAITYMKAMTGSEFLPEYDFNKPQNTFFIFEDGSIWKPQFQSDGGLFLYKVTEFKTINSQSIIGTGDIAISSGTKLYKHILYVSNNDDDLEISVTFISTSPTQITIQNTSQWSELSALIVMTTEGHESANGDNIYGPQIALSSTGGFYLEGYGTLDAEYVTYNISIADINTVNDIVTDL